MTMRVTSLEKYRKKSLLAGAAMKASPPGSRLAINASRGEKRGKTGSLKLVPSKQEPMSSISEDVSKPS